MNVFAKRASFLSHVTIAGFVALTCGWLATAISAQQAYVHLSPIIAKLAAEGKAIIVISSEMPELLGITDRIYVMSEGRIVGEMASADASQEKIMRSIVRGEGKAS